jgi:hypothetical protein
MSDPMYGTDYTDILVETSNPDALDVTLQQFGAALIGGGMPEGYDRVEGCYIARVFGPPGFIEFILTKQGYAKVVRRLEAPR